MICYLDSSALLKHYISEPGTDLVEEIWRKATVLGTATVTRAEVPAALAKVVRMQVLEEEKGLGCLRDFERDWVDLYRLGLRPGVLERAARLAWSLGLRGYDAVHLATALTWYDSAQQPLCFATFDAKLWAAAAESDLKPLPDDLPSLLERWRR